MSQQFTTVNISQEWLNLYFESSADSITYRVLNSFISSLTSEPDLTTMDKELRQYHSLQFAEFKTQYKAKRDSSGRVTILPSLVYLLEEDTSELGTFIMALHNYKLNKIATTFSNRILNLLYIKECRIIDKYRSEVVKTESFDIATEELVVENAIEDCIVANDATGSLEIVSEEAVQEEPVLVTGDVMVEEMPSDQGEELGDDQGEELVEELAEEQTITASRNGRYIPVTGPSLNPKAPTISDLFSDEPVTPSQPLIKPSGVDVFKKAAQERSAKEILKDIPDTPSPGYKQNTLKPESSPDYVPKQGNWHILMTDDED